MHTPNFKRYNHQVTPPCEELSPEQVAKLDQLTKLVATKDEHVTRPTLLRYLTARKWVVDDAFEALKATLQWREDFRVRDLVAKDFVVEGETGKIYSNGFDKDNRPILYMNPGRQNTTDSVAHIRFTVYAVELALAMLPPGVEKLLVVVDLRNDGRRQRSSVSEARQVIGIFANHYPERLGKVIILDAPWVFSCFFTLVSPFIDPVTRKKIVFSSLAKQDENHISNFIDSDTLYKSMGGNSLFEFNGNVYFEHAEAFFR